jgi:hypothetical protein
VPQPRPLSAPPAAYGWIFDLLFSGSAAVTWAPAGQLPGGYQVVDRFAVLPAGPDRTFMVSLASRAGASRALTAYNALRSPRKRLARTVLGLGLRAGVAQPLLGTKVDIGLAVGATAQQRSEALLGEYLRGLFGRPVVMAFGCGGGPYRKPVLQVFSSAGEALGYVKVGWNDWTRDAVRREATALAASSEAAGPGQVTRLGVPRLLHRARWRELELVVTAPLPKGISRVATDAPLPGTEILAEISRLTPVAESALGTSRWLAALRARIEAGVTDPVTAGRLARLADGAERQYGRVPLRCGSWHGDLVPWNLARLGERLYAWDWESSAPSAPVGFDALHFYFQVAFVAHHRPLEEAAGLAARSARPALDALGVAADQHGLVATLHLLDLAVRHEEAASSSGDIDARFFPGVLPVLERALAAPGTAHLHPMASSS